MTTILGMELEDLKYDVCDDNTVWYHVCDIENDVLFLMLFIRAWIQSNFRSMMLFISKHKTRMRDSNIQDKKCMEKLWLELWLNLVMIDYYYLETLGSLF